MGNQVDDEIAMYRRIEQSSKGHPGRDAVPDITGYILHRWARRQTPVSRPSATVGKCLGFLTSQPRRETACSNRGSRSSTVVFGFRLPSHGVPDYSHWFVHTLLYTVIY